MILKASMDGRDVKIVISLNSSIDYAFTFTLDYSQQLLYWIYYNIESCFYRIESSSVNGGSERKTIHSTFPDCHYSDKPAIAIDFFKGAVYYSSNMEDVYRYYSRYSDHTVFKITVEHTPKTTFFSYIRQYVCHVLNTYSGIKIISPERQLQGIAIILYLHKILESHCMYGYACMYYNAGVNPCAINNGGCAHLCLLSSNNSRNYSCACHSGTQLLQNRHDCTGRTAI